MPFAFPIQQIASSGKLVHTEIVFNEDEISNKLLKNSIPTFNYLLNKQYKETNENPQDIYMKRKLIELRILLEQENPFNSSIAQILDSKHFKTIVEFGPDIIPMILDELKFNSNYLVWAMNLITGMKISDKKISLSEASKLWVQWGRLNGYVK